MKHENKITTLSHYIYCPKNKNNGLSVPKEFMTGLIKVGITPAKNIDKKNFINCHKFERKV